MVESPVSHYRPIEKLIPAHWTETDIVANGIHQHVYRTGGDKPPVVLLHGFMESALAWMRAARALENDYDVIMPDTRGHGRSARLDDGGFAQELLTGDVAELTRALMPGQASVVGFSMGGGTGLYLAAAHPDLVRALVVAGWSDAAPAETDFSASPGYQAWLSRWLAYVRALPAQSHAERMLAGLSQLHPGTPLPPEDQYVASIDAAAHLDPQLVELSLGMWAGAAEGRASLEAALEQVTCPLLLMKSGSFPVPGAEVTVEEEPSDRPNVRVVRFANAGHLIDREQFDDFVHLVREFLAAHIG
jgi:pimeloyl-ACP methyl ester carboxylesterase